MCKKKVLFLITLAQNERYTLLQICNPCQKSWTLMTLCTSIIRVFQGLLADTVELLNSFISVSNHVTTECHLQLQYSPKVLGHFLHFLYSATNFHPPPPLPLKQCWFSGEVPTIMGTFRVHANFKCPTSEPTLFYGGGGCMFVATMTICGGKWFFSCFFLVSQGLL